MVVVLDSRSVCSSCVNGVNTLCDRGIALHCSRALCVLTVEKLHTHQHCGMSLLQMHIVC